MPHLPELVDLRIEIFRHWPYIYNGNAEHEKKYLLGYVETKLAVVVAAFEGTEIIGAATCLPLSAAPSQVQQPFVANQLNPQNYFYFGESVLRKAYRGKGIGMGFFKAREAYARSFCRYKTATFCAVQRHGEHPLRPAGFVALDAFWGKRGYTMQPQLQCEMSWTDLDNSQQTAKQLTFWTKNL